MGLCRRPSPCLGNSLDSWPSSLPQSLCSSYFIFQFIWGIISPRTFALSILLRVPIQTYTPSMCCFQNVLWLLLLHHYYNHYHHHHHHLHNNLLLLLLLQLLLYLIMLLHNMIITIINIKQYYYYWGLLCACYWDECFCMHILTTSLQGKCYLHAFLHHSAPAWGNWEIKGLICLRIHSELMGKSTFELRFFWYLRRGFVIVCSPAVLPVSARTGLVECGSQRRDTMKRNPFLLLIEYAEWSRKGWHVSIV